MEMSNELEELDVRMKEIQEECFHTVEALMGKSDKVSYQDATNVFIFKKIATLEAEIDYLKQKLQKYE